MTEDQVKVIAGMLQNNIGNTLTSELATGMLIFIRNAVPQEVEEPHQAEAE